MKHIIAVLLVLFAACSSDNGQDEAAVPDTAPRPYRAVAGLMTGMLSRGASGLQLVECSGTDTLHIVDGAASAGIKSDTQFFAIVRLSPGAGGPEVQDIVYQTAGRTDCFADFSTFDYRATGSNPGWVAEAAGSDLRIRRQGAADTVIQIVKRDSTATELVLSGGPATLSLTKQVCRSPTAGSTSALRAQLEIGGRTFSGCAIPGVPNR